MKFEIVQQLNNWHALHKEKKLYGRYITIEKIKPLIQQLTIPFRIEQLGLSFEKRSIYKVEIGSGPIKVLLWSQMHGNETTGTKALFDLFKYLKDESQTNFTNQILKNCTLVFIPMLNPDGATAYTRVNAQQIDLNRDAVALDAGESVLLNQVVNNLNPQYCFNLHDQRTIFSVGEKNLPASISFLAPSVDKERTITEGRKVTMSVIATMHKVLSQLIPNQIGRYADEFYPTATGDNFQKEGHHTVLIEAGHEKDDYQREKVRCYNFIALLSGLKHIAKGVDVADFATYFEIPNNEKQHLDIIYKNVNLSDTNTVIDVGILFKEELIDGRIAFIPTIELQGDLSTFTANSYIDLQDKKVILTDLLKI